MELWFVCTDQFGLHHEFTLHTWEIISSWQTAERWPEADTTVVTWPE